jgi:NADH dehydrogenase
VAADAPILVTGASGTVGSRVVERLRGQGWTVRCLVRRRPPATDRDVVQGDLGDGGSLDRAVTGTQAILHVAALTHARRARDYTETNLNGTRRLLDAAARHGVRRFVHASTRSINEAGGAYSVSKRRAEEAVRGAPVEHVIVRLSEIYGAGGREGLDDIVARARRGATILLVGDGADSVCPMHVDDAASALAASVGAATAGGRTYSVGGACVTTREFAEACVRAFGSRSRLRTVPVPAIEAMGRLGRVLPLPIYPDQLARLRAEKAPVVAEDALELGIHPRPLGEGLASLR